MSKYEQVGKLQSVKYDPVTDEVLVVFKIVNKDYKDFAMHWAKAESGRISFLGEDLVFNEESGQMRASGRRS